MSTGTNQERIEQNNQELDDMITIAQDLPDADEINEKIDAQDTIIENLKSALDNKAGKGGAKLNVFTQLTEPTTKKGIWLQTDKEMEHFISDEIIANNESWLQNPVTTLPYDAYGCLASSVGDEIYLFGSTCSNSTPYGGNKLAYKYNISTNTWIKITDCPLYSFRGGCVTIGTDIYIFGLFEGEPYSESNINNKVYKYDTLTDTYTQLANIPNRQYISSFNLVVVGTNIYMFGSGAGLAGKPADKYDTLTNTWTRLSDMPFSNSNSKPVVGIDNDTIYFFYVYVDNQTCVYKYTISTGLYSKVTSISEMLPSTYYGVSLDFRIKFGNNVYLLGCGDTSSNSQYGLYKFNFITNTFTKLQNSPVSLNYATAVLVNTDIYILGGYNNKRNVYVFHISPKEYEDNSVIIAQGRTYSVGYNVELLTTELAEEDYQPLYSFADAWYYTENDGLITNIPTYYGDGTQWINIKNPPQEEV